MSEKQSLFEIERKFLVKADFTPFVSRSYTIIQAYILASKEKAVRIRILADKAFITIKAKLELTEFSQFEWEKEIPVNEAKQLLQLCEKPYIEKERHEVDYRGKTFEVDVFGGDNKGLILAEIELSSENESFEKPDWLGEEVTGDKRYYNAYLAKKPFKEWGSGES